MHSGDPCRVQCGRLDLEGGAPGGGFEGRPCFLEFDCTLLSEHKVQQWSTNIMV